MLKMLRSGSEEGIEADLMIPITVGEEEIDIPIMKWENWPEPQWCLKDSPEGISGGNYSIEMGDHNIFCTYWGHGVDGIDQLRTEIPYKSDSNPEYGYTGKEDGWAKLYDYDGDLNQTILYKDGEALKSFLFFDDNLPKEELSYADNEITGIVRLWYSNGQQKSLYNFDHGSPIGYHMGWCENGTVNADVHYDDNGKLDGASKTWSCDGNLESCSIYSHGQYIRDCK